MQFFADLSTKEIIVRKLKYKNQERTHEVRESREETHDLLTKMNITLLSECYFYWTSKQTCGIVRSHASFHHRIVNLMSLHPSRRRAVSQPSLAPEQNMNSIHIESRGFLSNFTTHLLRR
jgi:hypothetical protein